MPVGVEVGVLVPFVEEARIVLGVTAVLSEIGEPFMPGDSTDAVTFLEQAESGVDHVLADKVGRGGCGEEVLGKAALRTSERPDLSCAPRLLGEPFAGVVTVPRSAFGPTEVSITGVGALAFLGTPEVDHGDGETFPSEVCCGFSCPRACQAGVPLFEYGGDGFFGCCSVKVRGKSGSVGHGDPYVLLLDSG